MGFVAQPSSIYADTSGEDNGFVRRLVGLEPQYRLQETFMFNKLFIALLGLGLSLATPVSANTRPIDKSGEIKYHQRLNRNFDIPQCNRHKPYLIKDAYTGRFKCVNRQKYERHHYRYGW